MKNILLYALLVVFTITSCEKDDNTGTSQSNSSGNNLGTGKSANQILSAGQFTSMNVEIMFMPGFQPDAAAIGNLSAFLNSLANKPAGITFTQRQINASGKTVLTLDEIVAIENANRTAFNSGSNLGVSVLYVDADYNQGNTIGVAYKNTSLVIFGKTVVNNSGGVNQVSRTKLESTGLHHEFGHLMGLVNLGSNMVTNHEDGAHERHCITTTCLMYFATQTNMMAGVLLSGPIPTLDANCRADLQANGGK